jgi:hypothetical protein
MDLGTVLAAMTGVGAAVGGFVGMRSAKTQNAAGINQLLGSKIAVLENDAKAKDALIEELKEQVKILTELVTQKADVESVKKKLDEIKAIIDKVAIKVEA